MEVIDLINDKSLFDMIVTLGESIPQSIKDDLMTCKSSQVYDRWYQRYCEFKNGMVEQSLTNGFLLWLQSLKETFSSSTIWQAASCVNKKLKLDHNMDLIKHPVVKEYLKKLSKTYVPKKAAVFTQDELNKFLLEAPSNIEFLLVKSVFVVGIHGALRVSEICNLTFDDITKQDDTFSVRIKYSKTDPAGLGHSFLISKTDGSPTCPYTIFEEYLAKFPLKTGRLWRKFKNDETPSNSPIGVNTLAQYPKQIAKFLKLEGEYSGHSFRRTSATVLADNGCSTLQLKQHGRWKSSTVAEGYVNSSKRSKLDISRLITQTQPSSSSTKPSSSDDIGTKNFYNCHIIMKN